MVIHSSFEELNKAAIERVVEHHVIEGKTLEYKRELPGPADEDKRQFLADVCSFANAAGGYILYGVEEDDADGKKTGKPKAAIGIEGLNADQEKLRLENLMRDAIDPRIPGVQIKAIEGFEKGPVLVIRIPKSWAAPHMVTFKNLSRFFSRNSAGKYQLDVREIRAAFALSEELPRRIQRFRDDRLAKILSDEGPLAMCDGGKLVIHLIPVSAMEAGAQLDMDELLRKTESIRLFDYASQNERFNLEGWLKYTSDGTTGRGWAYVQFFRTGAIEVVDAYNVRPDQEENRWYTKGVAGSHKVVNPIDGLLLGNVALALLRQLMRYLGSIGVDPPVYLFMTVTGVKGATIKDHGGPNYPLRRHLSQFLIDRDILFLPEILIDDLNAPVDRLVRPAFDALWQAAGRSRCPHYNDQGNWPS